METSMEGGDFYLASTSTHSNHDVWLINLGASFHMTPHMEWFCEYEKNNGGDVFLGNNFIAKIIRRGRGKLLLKDIRIRTLPGIFHILDLARNSISVSKMNDVDVHTIFGKETCMIVRGALGLSLQGEFGLELCTSYWKALSPVVVTVPLFLRMKLIEILLFM
jgi:hypothetical protein